MTYVGQRVAGDYMHLTALDTSIRQTPHCAFVLDRV
jgi:hypothetical protein